ncbi:CidA/LrgA family protein [Acinetobacter genomosp. 15BJ]|uniref:CidA/LrgA family protein n=1 Tax=Acinetobacter genomosp. 15BJ TaxID=106651 RepID=R9AZP9_9GAMM|nr:CidA/LrgA family protein [Acinetobacter genomosp. 15BJ]EOR07647.1 holin-like protein [Acinetobacter genomosp. 15BJ]MCH7292209.1 CidA/LrgA family protein [Acinetobacter genomosp. 15BJ]MDO3656138.1 CidA/LrgA family protein [Acinetobacter genomosp. 15BJ]
MSTKAVSKSLPQNSLLALIKQILILAGFWLAGYVLNQKLGIPISAGILGMFLLLFSLFFKVIKMDQVAIGATFVLGELLLFFVPVVVAVVQYKSLFMTEGWQIVLSIAVGTILVMLSTCLTIHYYNRLKSYLHTRKRFQHKHI